MRQNSETMEAAILSRFLQNVYPDVIYHFDFGTGAKMTIGQAVQQNRLNGGRRGYPDLFIAEPRGGKAGLFIELKKSGVRLTRQSDGEWATTHIAEQAQTLEELRQRGYEAEFCVGILEAQELITNYLEQEEGEEEEEEL